MNRIRKTASLLSGLEWKTVDVLLGRLDPEQARALRREMMALDGVSVQETERLAEEFLQQVGGGHRARRQNTVMEHQLAVPVTYGPPRRTATAARFDENAWQPEEKRPARQPSKAFEFFRHVDVEEIVREISSEHPRTAAVVLAHLPASLAGEVLGNLPTSLQIDVARHLSEFGADFEDMDRQVLQDIETSLRERFQRRLDDQRRRARSSAAVQHILKSTDAKMQARVLSNLEAPRLESLRTFDDLDRLGDAELLRLFRSVDSVTAMLALVGAKPSLIERVTNRFTPTEEHEMRQQLKRLGPIGKDDVLKARTTILGKLTMDN